MCDFCVGKLEVILILDRQTGCGIQSSKKQTGIKWRNAVREPNGLGMMCIFYDLDSLWKNLDKSRQQVPHRCTNTIHHCSEKAREREREKRDLHDDRAVQIFPSKLKTKPKD